MIISMYKLGKLKRIRKFCFSGNLRPKNSKCINVSSFLATSAVALDALNYEFTSQMCVANAHL